MRVRRFVTQISEDQGHFTVAGAPGQVATNGDETERSDDALADIYTSRLEDGGVIESTDQGRNQTELITSYFGEMAGKISVEKMIKPFTGEGDVLAWLQKVELVAKLGGFKDLASFIPLYLEDGALAVYLEMPDEKKVDASLIQDELVKAFSDNQFVAFSKLKAVRWAGEPVDV